jgi:hypothetical protein
MADGTPAPAGEHQLADGTMIELDENGIIIEISSKEEEVVPEVDTEIEAKKEEDKKIAEMQEQFEAQIAELKAAKEVSDAKVLELENKVKQGFAQVAELIEALSNVPSADPIQKPSNFSEFVSNKDIKEERLNKYRQALLNN